MRSKTIPKFAQQWVLLAAILPSIAKCEDTYEYCIVGAGPGGIQLGHLFHKAGRNYRIFESSHRAGSFFAKDGRSMPVHRRLLSLNKRVVGSESTAELRMRHDWNTLLDAPEVLPVTNRTKELYPHADVIADYCQDFAKPQVDAGKIAFETTVTHVSRCEPGAKEGQLCITTTIGTAKCDVLIWAAGLQTSNKLGKVDKEAEPFITYYPDLAKKSAEDFEGKSVLVLGGGNAAFESVEWLQDYAQILLNARQQLLGWEITTRATDEKPGQPSQAAGLRFAMMTHYVGDLRATRLSMFDHYQLKMPDRLSRPDLLQTDETRGQALPCSKNGIIGICFFGEGLLTLQDKNKPQKGMLQVGESFGEQTQVLLEPKLEKYLKDRGLGTKKDYKFVRMQDHDKKSTITQQAGGERAFTFYLKKSVILKDPEIVDFLKNATENDGVSKTGPFHHHGQSVAFFDAIVACLGFSADLSMFDSKSLPVQTVVNKKYPKISDNYEADGVPGLFFGGALAHSLDYRKSGGGFIHGFRYAMRSLFRYFEETRHGVSHPAKSINFNDDSRLLAEHIMDRWGNAAGPYHMFSGTLIEGIVFEPTDGGYQALYMEELIPSHFFKKCKERYCLMWFFEYGKKFEGPQALEGDNVGGKNRGSAEKSSFLHPKMEFFKPSPTHASPRWTWAKRVKASLTHVGLETRDFKFGKFHEHVQPLLSFLEQVRAMLPSNVQQI